MSDGNLIPASVGHHDTSLPPNTGFNACTDCGEVVVTVTIPMPDDPDADPYDGNLAIAVMHAYVMEHAERVHPVECRRRYGIRFPRGDSIEDYLRLQRVIR